MTDAKAAIKMYNKKWNVRYQITCKIDYTNYYLKFFIWNLGIFYNSFTC